MNKKEKKIKAKKIELKIICNLYNKLGTDSYYICIQFEKNQKINTSHNDSISVRKARYKKYKFFYDWIKKEALKLDVDGVYHNPDDKPYEANFVWAKKSSGSQIVSPSYKLNKLKEFIDKIKKDIEKLEN